MEALKLAKGYDEILSSIDSLLKLREYLKAYGIEKYISYELGLISDYTYYTGIIFQGYTYGTGEPIVKGGRYDKLLSHCCNRLCNCCGSAHGSIKPSGY